MRINKTVTLSLAAIFTVAAMVLGMTSLFTVGIKAEENTMTSGNIRIVQRELQRAKGVSSHYNDKNNPLHDGDLIPFIQGQPLYPAHPDNGQSNPYATEQSPDRLIYWGSYVTNEGACNGLWNDQKLVGVMDKFVFVENTGSLPCYYRTWIALECPEGMEFSNNADKELIMNINNHSLFDWKELGYVTINSTRYFVMCATYTAKLDAGEISYPSLLQVVMTHNTTTAQAEKLGNTYDILSFTQACQTGIFNTDENAADALATCFGGSPSLVNHPWANATFGEFAWDFKTLERAVNNKSTKFTATLVEDVTLSGNLFDRSVTVSYDATIDLNNHTISANGNEKITATGNKLTFVGNGKVELEKNKIIANELVIKGGTWIFDPTAWLADGYKTVKNGSVWTVTKE